MSQNDFDRYVAPVAAGQTVKFRETIKNVPAFLRGVIGTVDSYCVPCDEYGEPLANVLADANVLAAIPVRVKLADGKRVTVARHHISAKSSKLA